MEKNKEDLLAMFIEAVNDSITSMTSEDTDCGVEYYPKFRFMPEIAFTDEHVEAIRSMAVDGDENAESLLELFENIDELNFDL